MNLALALTAARHGAALANYVAVVGLVKDGSGRLSGAIVRDRLGGAEWEVRARVVLNAAGPYVDELRRLDDPGDTPLLRVSAGSHLVLGERFPAPDTGFLIPRTEDGRVIFVLPWHGQLLAGTTEVDAQVTEEPLPARQEVSYLLAHLRNYLNLPAGPGDVMAAWSGLRPLDRRPAAAGGRRPPPAPRHRGADPRPLPEHQPQRADHRRRRQVDHLPGDGRARREPRRGGGWPGAAAHVADPHHAVARRGRLPPGRRRPAAPVPPGRRRRRSPRPGIRRPRPRGGAIGRRRDTARGWRRAIPTWRPRWCTPRATRRPAPWTTCWRGARGWRSSTAWRPWPACRGWRSCWPRSWVGAPASAGATRTPPGPAWRLRRRSSPASGAR